jgi:transcriptional regulator GlxA family with amidase domain
LLARQGQVRVEELASSAHYSPRQLERHFKRWVGEPPKALARRMRFEAARDHLATNPDIPVPTEYSVRIVAAAVAGQN